MSSENKQSKEAEFLQHYDQFADAIFRYIAIQISDRERAKELAQDVFMKAWEYITENGEIRQMKAFLFHLSRNIVIDEWRRKYRSNLSIEDLTDKGVDFWDENEPSAIEKISNEGDHKEILGLVGNLPATYREPILLRYVEDLSIKEISKILKTTENSVSVRIHRGLERIKKSMEDKEV